MSFCSGRLPKPETARGAASARFQLCTLRGSVAEIRRERRRTVFPTRHFFSAPRNVLPAVANCGETKALCGSNCSQICPFSPQSDSHPIRIQAARGAFSVPEHNEKRRYIAARGSGRARHNLTSFRHRRGWMVDTCPGHSHTRPRPFVDGRYHARHRTNI